MDFYRYLLHSVVEVILGIPFTYEVNDDVRKILEDFRNTINFCIERF